MKKRILSLALALALAMSLAIPALAGEITTETTGTTPVTYNVSQSFTVTIPESVVLAADGVSKGTGTGTVTVSDAVIPFGKSLKVTITNATNYDTGFRMKDGANESYLAYTIKIGATPVVKDTAFLTVPAGTATGTAALSYAASAPTKAGNYSDSLTFTVSVGQ